MPSSTGDAAVEGEPPCGNPYRILGLDPSTATDADITRAYRKLALRLHPDKQKQKNLPRGEADEIARKFHSVNEARSFLLDAEHSAERRKYDAALRSAEARRVRDGRREREMSDRRRTMKERLDEKERRSAAGRASAAGASAARPADDDDELLERLRRRGKQMREEQADREAAEDARARKKRKKETDTALQMRQVRVKWSRSKFGSDRGAESRLAEVLSRFGTVEEVEVVGSKGNAAMVTFADAGSCRPCVEAYADSDVMRATFVGERKDGEEVRGAPPSSRRSARDSESLEERKMRQAAERERLLRQMEMDEGGGGVGGVDGEGRGSGQGQGTDRGGGTAQAAAGADGRPSSASAARAKSRPSWADYPPQFPITAEDRGLSPLEMLEKAERRVLGGILGEDALRRIQVNQ